MRDYKAEFQKLVEDAIADGWIPAWVDLVEFNDIYLEECEDASRYFYFWSPEEIQKVLKGEI